MMIALAQTKTLGAPSTGHHAHAAATAAGGGLPGAAASDAWAVPVVPCVAVNDTGVEDVYRALEAHLAWLNSTEAGQGRRAARTRRDFMRTLRQTLVDAALAQHTQLIEELTADVVAGRRDPYSASRELVQRFAASET
jgi:putative protein kinase ArgK-like GTPase of G3E family